MIVNEDNINRVINFWFKECKPSDWFKKDANFDLLIKNKFSKLVNLALNNQFQEIADINEDSAIDVLDIVLLVQLILEI